MLHLLAQSTQRWDTTTWVLLCVAAAATMYVMYRSRRRWKDPLSPKKVVPSATLSPAQQRAVERQMQELLVELSDMARQITGQLDTRAAKLEILIRQADERIARLSATSSNAAPMPFAASDQATTDPPEPDAEVVAPESRTPEQPVIAAGGDADEIVPAPASHREVYVLADEGRSLQQIADQLARPRGEIELILALRPRTPVEESKSA